MNQRMPPLDYSKEYNIIFTVTPSVTDQNPYDPMFSDTNPVELKVTKGSKNYTYKIDL